MGSRRPLRTWGLVVLLAAVLLTAGPAAAAEPAVLAAVGDGGRVPLGLAALGALLGVSAFGVRLWSERPGRRRQ